MIRFAVKATRYFSVAQKNTFPEKMFPSDYYKRLVETRKVKYDENQVELVKAFDNLLNDLNVHFSQKRKLEQEKGLIKMFKKSNFLQRKDSSMGSNIPKSLYIYGSPGTGKTFLMEILYRCLSTEKKIQVHFNKFISDIHKKLHLLRENNKSVEINMFEKLAVDIKYKTNVIFFDEFQVTDITNAVILKSLFTELINKGVVIISTSNRHPNDLYKNGLQREQIFVPFIDYLRKHCKVVCLDSGIDYRNTGTRLKDIYYYPINDFNSSLFQKAINKVTKNGSLISSTLEITGRTLKIPQTYKRTCVLEFQSICGVALGAEDFQAIAKRFRTVFLKNVPRINSDGGDVLRRFILLIDELYREKVRLVILAEVALEEVFEVEEGSGEGRDEVFAWERCKSRLIEMQSKEYLDDAYRVNKRWK